MDEEKVLEALNKVSTAQRVATIQMRAVNVGSKQETNKRKRAIIEKQGKQSKKSKAA